MFGNDDPEYRIRFFGDETTVARCSSLGWGYFLVDRAGREFYPADGDPQWSARPAGIVSIHPTHGTMEGRNEGTATITLRVSGARASRQVTVTPFEPIPYPPPPADSVTLTWFPDSVVVGDSTYATLRFWPGFPFPVGHRGDEWSSDNPSVANAHPCGVIYGVSRGVARITGRFGTASASRMITIH